MPLLFPSDHAIQRGTLEGSMEVCDGAQCRWGMERIKIYVQIKIAVISIYEKAPVKGVQVDEGINILDKLINSNNYPIERSTITTINGTET